MGYQNFFATRLFTDIGAADTTITLENPPAVTSGRLVLEARNTSKREIISYTGVSGNDITGVTRGVGGTSATDHTKNSLVEMNVVAEDLEDALNVPEDIETRFNEVISDHVASGLVVTDDTGLTADISAGVAYINGKRLAISAVSNRTFTASKDTYIDLGDNGVLDYNEVANGAAQPALAASHIRLAMVRTNATDTTAIILYSNPSSLIQSNGWQGGLPPVSSVTHNGNRSYTLTHASSVASTISEGMRRRFTRTVAANTYMGGAFNGSSHYFTKTSPTGTLGTVTNNFTIEAYVQPTSYAAAPICGRSDATRANAIGVEMTATGAIRAYVFNGGTGNYRYIDTSQSLPLNKKTHVAVTWASGTILIYLDGVSVPLNTVATAGTNPTTAGTGGDFSIGRAGAHTASYFAGYISNVAVFDAVLSAATIKQHATYKLTGSETNCIGAWSLDNTAVNQQAPGTNDLTATGGVGYTNISPFGNNGVSSTLEYGLTMSVSSDGLTEVVQVPEGCALPTSGGITASAYSTNANPFGFVSDKGRWYLSSMGRVIASKATPASSTYYFTEAGSVSLSVPVGKFTGYAKCICQADKAGNNASPYVAVSTSSSSASEGRFVRLSEAYQAIIASHSIPLEISNSVATTYYILLGTTASPPSNIYMRGDITPTEIMLLPAGL